MIVAPEHGGILLVGVVVKRGFPGHDPVFWIAIAFRSGFPSMQVHHGADGRLVRFGAVDCAVHRQEMLAGKSIHPFHQQGLTGARLECWARSRRSEAPELRSWQVSMNFTGNGLRLDSIKRNL